MFYAKIILVIYLKNNYLNALLNLKKLKKISYFFTQKQYLFLFPKEYISAIVMLL